MFIRVVIFLSINLKLVILSPKPLHFQTFSNPKSKTLLGGSWVVISGAISPVIWVISKVTLLITPLTTTHEPPSKLQSLNP